MKLKEIFTIYFKKIWYTILLILSTIYIWHFKSNIYQLKEINVTNLIFILWIVLLLFPLFSEMEFLGIKLKKEVEKAKAEVKENLNDLYMQIMELKISNSNTNTINFGNDVLPSEQKIKEMCQEFLNNLNTIDDNLNGLKSKTQENKSTEPGIHDIVDVDAEIAEESVYLFKVRLIIEKNLTDLCEKTGYNGRKSMFTMLEYLYKCEVINLKTVDLIRQIVKIANRGVHNEIVSNKYINFIKQVFPELKKQLYGINTQLHYHTCSRCNYSGYSPIENVCPKCGFISDDD
ncbi:hypothetical protein [Clostridium felsineum]|uniref:hypothetical protein n=1 Tax=Clostridium felsineum TaxID=36839 RepID=UPI00098CB511|nr:hypothetical protein [Clostridium felsineum]URZ15459.1 hypothetical protein CLFE_014990 [Clostridium felsineum DSM 794]